MRRGRRFYWVLRRARPKAFLTRCETPGAGAVFMGVAQALNVVNKPLADPAFSKA